MRSTASASRLAWAGLLAYVAALIPFAPAVFSAENKKRTIAGPYVRKILNVFYGVLIIAISFIFFCSANGKAAELHVRTTTYSGIPLNERISIRVHGILRHVPAGYLWPWPNQSARKKMNEWENLSFDFWMPSGRYVEIDPIEYAGFLPKEHGRPAPQPTAYVVKVRTMRPVKVDETGYVSPELGYHNLISIAGASSYSQEQEAFGLIRFWRNNWAYPKSEPFVRYKHIDKSDPQILLRCTPKHKAVVNPSCSGTVHFVAESLGFFVDFPRSELPHWREIVATVRDLFRSWRSTS